MIILPIGKADRRVGHVTFNAKKDDAFGVDLLDRLRHDRHTESRCHHVND